MKKLVVVRHAKSSWKNPGLRDRDRPLNKRGFRDAPFMAKIMADQGERPDRLISSTALRAFTTASYFAEAFGLKAEDILKVPEIYEAYYRDILSMVNELENQWDIVYIFGHNPTFTDFVNQFQGGGRISNMPTCGIVEIEAEVNQWSDFSLKNAKVVRFHYPKQYFS